MGKETGKEPKVAIYRLREKEENRLRINRIRASQNEKDKKNECEASKLRIKSVRARRAPEEIDLEKRQQGKERQP